LHFPPQPSDDIRIGIAAHTDYGLCTILAQDDVEALQVHYNDQWHNIKTVPNALLVNAGDMLQRWTNGLFKSPIHRVINYSGKHRFSIPFFFDPNFNAEVECIEECRKETGEAKYAPIKYADYLMGLHNKTIVEHQKKLENKNM